MHVQLFHSHVPLSWYNLYMSNVCLEPLENLFCLQIQMSIEIYSVQVHLTGLFEIVVQCDVDGCFISHCNLVCPGAPFINRG